MIYNLINHGNYLYAKEGKKSYYINQAVVQQIFIHGRKKSVAIEHLMGFYEKDFNLIPCFMVLHYQMTSVPNGWDHQPKVKTMEGKFQYLMNQTHGKKFKSKLQVLPLEKESEWVQERRTK